MWLCFIFGILIFEKLSLSAILVNVFLIFSFLFLVLSFFKIDFFSKVKDYVLSIFFVVLGIFAHHLNNKEKVLPEFPNSSEVIFTLSKKLNSNEKNKRYEVNVLKVNEKRIDLGLVLFVPKEENELDFKHFYNAEIYLNKVKGIEHNFGFDYQKYLARKHIYYQGYASDSYQIADKGNLTLSEKIKQKRLEVLRNIDQAKLSEKARAFTKGIILADRTEMDQETVEDFSKSGLVHILAISGSHMAIIFWLILFILKPLFTARFRNFPIVISLIFICLFAIFIDYGSSVMRSCIMITAYYLYVLLQRKPDLLHAMAISGFAILIFDTNQLFDVGFQLSFIAVLGIFWLNEPILKYLPKPKNSVQNFFVNVVSISIAAQIVTIPLVIYYFHQYSLISVIANLVVIPFSEMIIIFALSMAILLGFGFEIPWLNTIYDSGVHYLLKVIHFFADLDTFFFKNVSMHWLEVIILFIIIYFLRKVLWLHHLKSLFKVGFLVILFLMIRIGFNIYEYSKSEVIVHEFFTHKIISVKEGDKIVFFLKDSKNFEKQKKYIIEPYLVAKRTNFVKIIIVPQNVKSLVINDRNYSVE
ncbi:ComEC family competence protein [Cloacibacterium sp. TD35]|nr:ComEC/Rec2 family competence protein [Cloacibacterium sp. TD35]WDT69160.1 ComEC family competence protein [Cloacibacterium sp. TD35]